MAMEKNIDNITHLSNVLLNCNKPVLMQSEFNLIIQNNKIGKSTITKIKKSLLENKIVKIVTLKSDNYKNIDRVIIPSLKPSQYHYAVSLRNGTYLSHSSAINILGLTQQVPNIIYVNKEQSPKKQSIGPITQDSIDRAFSHQQRKSKYVFKVENYQIVLLSGKYTKNAGVEIDKTIGIPRTCLERTLIDITVRPKYAGGVFKVLEAFKSSIDNIDYKKLLMLYNQLGYKYPYHQSIGFYLENAGARKEDLKIYYDMGINFNFYLDYSIASPKLDNSWRVYFPLGI